MIKLKKDITRKKIPENENPEKIVNITEKIFNLNNQQKVKGCSGMLVSRSSDLSHVAKVSNHSDLKMISSKQMFQRLPAALAQVKAVNTSKIVLN